MEIMIEVRECRIEEQKEQKRLTRQSRFVKLVR